MVANSTTGSPASGGGRMDMVSPVTQSNRTDSVLSALSMFAYVASAIKYVNRDPLSTTTGVQAVVEIGFVAVAAILAGVVCVRRGVVPRPTTPAIGFGAFAALALLSSVFSYWPILSLIKGSMLVVILFVAVGLCASRPPSDVLKYFYWSSLIIIAVGVCLKCASHEPLFDMDEYSGRIRFTVFALHWGSLADLSALTILIGRMLPRRPHWSFQLALFGINVATCARWSSASLLVVIVASSIWSSRVSLKSVTVGMFGLATASLIAWIVLTAQIPIGRIPFERFYGDKVTLDEIASLNGRTGVWTESLPLIPGTLVFGYGVEGARAAILREFEWAGHAHNAYLEVLFAGGLPGLLVFLAAWGSAIVKTLQTESPSRPLALGLHVYMFTCGLTDPNMTLLQFLPVFLIVCMDADLRAAPLSVLSGALTRNKALLSRRADPLSCAHA